MTKQIFTDPNIEEAYKDYDLGLRKKRLITGLWIAIILIPIFGFLDYVMYPHVLIGLLEARLIADLVLLVVLFLVIKMKNYINIKWMGFAWATSIFILINYLILLTEGANSPYYAGLNLVIVVASVVLPWTLFESVMACCLMIALYITTLILHVTINNADYNMPLVINNIFFLSGTSIICVVASLFNSQLRIKEFESNYKLEQKNVALEQANIELEQVLLKLKAVKAELIQSEKINALGHLSAGILHEINNPLNYCMMSVELLKNYPEVMQNKNAEEKVSDIEEGMKRIKDITTGLHSFAHPQEASRNSKFKLNDAINSAIKFTAHLYYSTELENRISDEVNVYGSKTNIVQALIIFLTNAVRAIEKSGKTTDSSGRKEGKIIFSAEDRKNKSVISIKDNGTGILEENMTRIFNPFFTTNEVGQGIGMGLSVAQTIIANHGSELKVSSKYGDGATFYFELPTELEDKK